MTSIHKVSFQCSNTKGEEPRSSLAGRVSLFALGVLATIGGVLVLAQTAANFLPLPPNYGFALLGGGILLCVTGMVIRVVRTEPSEGEKTRASLSRKEVAQSEDVDELAGFDELVDNWASQDGEKDEKRIEAALVMKECFKENREKLILDNMQLSSLPDIFGYLIHVKSIALRHNKLSELPASFLRLEGMEELIMHDNLFTEFPTVLPSSLNRLWIYNNLIKEIPDHIQDLANLEQLYFGRNQIATISPHFWTLTKLARLRLDKNRIELFPPELANLERLIGLNLDRNPSGKLTKEVFDLDYLDRISISRDQLPDSIQVEDGKYQQKEGRTVTVSIHES